MWDFFSRLLEPNNSSPDYQSEIQADSRAAERILERLRAGDTLQSVGIQLKAPDGSIKQVLLDSNGLSENGALAHSRWLTRDFTAAKRAEESLRESEERFRQLAECIQDVFWILETEQNRIIYISPAYEEIWGASREQLLEDNWSGWKAIHADDRQRVREAFLAKVYKGSYSEVYRVVRTDGTIRWVKDRAFPVRNAEGKIFRVVGTVEDITDRKRAEHAWRFLADASEALASLDGYEVALQKVADLAVPFFADGCAVDLVARDGSLKRVAAAHKTVEIPNPSRDPRQGQPPPCESHFGPRHVLATGGAQWLSEIPDSLLIEAADDEGQLRSLRELQFKSYLGVPLVVRDNTLGVISFATNQPGCRYDSSDLDLAKDLARRAATAIENAQLYGELREADRRKDEFLAMLAHELRNPLAPLRSGLELLGAGPNDGETIEAVRETMGRQVQHIVRLVDDLLDVSRITRGKIKLQTGPVDLAPTVYHAVEEAQPIISAQGHRLTISLPGDPIWVQGDPIRLAQIISNLLHNAAKYTEKGGEIALSVERDGHEAVLRVRDNGIGISPEMLPRIFDLFTQADRTIERSQGGLGIGLTVVRSLVIMHGGTIAATSEGLGKGSEFAVRLPAMTEPPKLEPAARKPRPSGRRRVLVVDDNVGAATILAKLLTKLWAHEVVVAHDGVSALELAKKHRPQIVLLDIGLPGMDGYEVAKRLRGPLQFNETLIAAVTGYGLDSDRLRSTEAGIDEHLVKPISVSVLEKLFAHPKLASQASESPGKNAHACPEGHSSDE